MKEKHIPVSDLAGLTQEVFNREGAIEFIATGGSMWPHIRHGDRLTARPFRTGETPRPGWVVVYQPDKGRIAVHRILGRSTPGVVLIRGDAYGGDPEIVAENAVLGRVVCQRRGSRLTDLTSRRSQMWALGIAKSGRFRVIVLSLLRNLWRAAKEGKQQLKQRN